MSRTSAQHVNSSGKITSRTRNVHGVEKSDAEAVTGNRVHGTNRVMGVN